MIIRLAGASGSLEIDDPQNFRAFSVKVEGSIDPAEQARLLAPIAVTSSREHAWISEQALREWPSLGGEAWWQEGLSNMIRAAERFGWVDPANRSIRAHIEYVSSVELPEGQSG
jgi:predicted transcriptional regulator